MTFKIKNGIFAALFIFLFAIVILTLAGVIVPGTGFVGPFPASVFWAVSLCFSFLALSVGGYFFLFKGWAAEIDAKDLDE